MIKYFYIFVVVLVLFSCSEMPTRDNPWDMGYFCSCAPELYFERLSQNQIKLTWDWEYEIDIIEGFRIEKKAVGDDWQLYADNINADTRQWTDNNSNYHDSYRIKAFYEEYESDISDEVPVETEVIIFVQGGIYEMGDHFNEGESNEMPVHNVAISSFYIGQHEVTQAEYESVMGENPAYNYGVGDDYPVYFVSWYDAVEYCNALSIQSGLTPCYDTSDWSCDFSANGYRLPTEAEWEYAARGGVNWEDNYRYSGTTDELGEYAVYSANDPGHAEEVESKLPNQLGLYDMSGNVWEWCYDWYDGDYYETSSEINPVGPSSGASRVLRGGSWCINARYCRSAIRSDYTPDCSCCNIGFRLARSSY